MKSPLDYVPALLTTLPRPWYRHAEPYLVVYWTGPAECPVASLAVTAEGLKVQVDALFNSEQEIDGLQDLITMAHRQFTDRLALGLEPHPVQEDRDFLGFLQEPVEVKGANDDFPDSEPRGSWEY